MTIQIQVYEETKFSIIPKRCGVEVYYNGKFWETADSYSEAKADIKKAVM